MSEVRLRPIPSNSRMWTWEDVIAKIVKKEDVLGRWYALTYYDCCQSGRPSGPNRLFFNSVQTPFVTLFRFSSVQYVDVVVVQIQKLYILNYRCVRQKTE